MMLRDRRVIAGLALAVVGAATYVGFVAGRRYPWERLDEWLGRGPPPPPGWSRRAVVPRARYEATTFVANGKIYVLGGFYDHPLRALGRVDVYDPGTDAWTQRRDMPEATTHRNAVVIGDTVWMAGGFVGDNPGPATTHVWLYDVRTDQWSQGPPLPQPRGGGALYHAGAQMHYVGGYGLDRNASMSDHWTLDLAARGSGWQVAPALPRPRGHFAGVVVGDTLYVVGGTERHDPVQVDVDWVDRFDPRTGRWSEAAPLPAPRSHIEPSTFVFDGRILTAAGRDNTSRGHVQSDVLSYDPATNAWLPVARLPQGRVAPLALAVGDALYFGVGGNAEYQVADSTLWVHDVAAPWQRLGDMPARMGEVTAVVAGGRVLIIGEGSPLTLRYDPANDRWDAPEQLALRPEDGNHHAGEWVDGRWYVIGGLGSRPVGRVMQMYDPVANRWSLGPDLPWGAGSAASAVINGTLYIAGGIDGDSTVGLAARLDARRGAWIPVAPMPLPRNHAASATDGRRLYIFGGRGPGSGNSNRVDNGFAETQIYDPATDRWLVSGSGPGAPAPLPQGRGGMGKAIYARGEFWVFGGETRDGPGATPQHVYDRVDIYDPVRNQWRAGPPMPTARHGIFPVLIGDRIYILGGGMAAGNTASAVVEYLNLDRVPPAAR
jgi:N-acetylneuraminic acid mutarotase